MKNYLQDGNTIGITNKAATTILSGDPVAVGDLLAVAIVDIPKDETGDGRTTGVVILPKLAADDIAQGKSVFLKGGKIQLDAAGATPAGKAWEAAGANTTTVAVRLNG
jgi:predicted RecA/RadA family phage recombinase